MPDRNSPETPKPQIDKFRDLARELEADEDPARFEGGLRQIAKYKGHWRVDFAVPHGHRANFYPEDPEHTYRPGPIFATPQEVHNWLRKNGCTQSEADADIWFD